MTDDTISIEVDGKPVAAKKGQMLIEVTDQAGAYVPRFCYHSKLSVAANCRMCLVDIDGAPKPIPACAQPVNDGMKVFTRSPRAIAAQKATMEFLLINHPLDCPICDQGGECELQDLAMGYGRDVSRYNDGKRVVKDKDIGPLISTDMTRCIHCTRCVRFGEEIQGNPQLGTTARGENVVISTYVEQSIDHELSANIIDLCPVGALNNKPYRYSARAWEMMQHAAVSPHDCVGSNLYAHVLRGTVKRIVPRENEAINETWIADRDRFSYEAIYSDQRLLSPRMKVDGEWQDIGWDDALAAAAEALTTAGSSGFIASPAITVEEAHLVAKLARHLGTDNLDHRIGRRDTSDQDGDPVFESLGCGIDELESRDAVLVAGADLRAEAPILAHRLRKAALAGASVNFVNTEEFEYFFDVDNYASGDGLVAMLSGIAVAAGASIDGVEPSDTQRRIARALADAERGHILLGQIADRHAVSSALRNVAAQIAQRTGCSLGFVTAGPNSAGASLAGVLPHRQAGGEARAAAGLAVAQMLDIELDVLVLVNVEPTDIKAVADAVDAVGRHNFVIALTSFLADDLLEAADLLLPIGTFAESSGTYVNVTGEWQSFNGFASPVGEARPAWKVLRVLGNLADADGFDYVSSDEVLAECRQAFGAVAAGSRDVAGKVARPNGADAAGDTINTPIYSVDGLVRRARALQRTPAARRARGEGTG